MIDMLYLVVVTIKSTNSFFVISGLPENLKAMEAMEVDNGVGEPSKGAPKQVRSLGVIFFRTFFNRLYPN